MNNEKDRFGETMRLVERAKEDIYFAERDRELLEKLRAQLKKVAAEMAEAPAIKCPKCSGKLENYTFMEFLLDKCGNCGGIWLDQGELEGVLKKISQSPLASVLKRFLSRESRDDK